MKWLKFSLYTLVLTSMTLSAVAGCSSNKAEKIDASQYTAEDEEGEEDPADVDSSNE